MPSTDTHIEASADTVDAAISQALGKLGVRREEVDVKVIDEGKKGFLGLFGNRPARVFVSLKRRKAVGGGPPPRPARRESGEGGAPASADLRPIADNAREILSTILTKMGFSAQVTSNVRDNQVALTIDCPEREGLLIGRRGETLEALQHLVTRVASRNSKERAPIAVDVSGYRTRHDDTLVARAVEMGQEVLRTGRELKTDPMLASDRRLIHRALAEIKGIETQAIGNGNQKRILIRPTGDVPAGAAREGEPRHAMRDGGERGFGADRGDRGGRGGDRGERGERGDRGHSRGGARGGRDRDRDRRGPRPDRGPRRFDERRPAASSGASEERSFSRPTDRSEHAPVDRDRSGPEPLDLLGSLRGAMVPPPANEPEPETDASDKIGARSRRRRPARRRL
jgi:spoIIIJ-associated protein